MYSGRSVEAIVIVFVGGLAILGFVGFLFFLLYFGLQYLVLPLMQSFGLSKRKKVEEKRE